MNHIKHLKNERAVDVPLSFCICKKETDREINELYNKDNLSDRLEFSGEQQMKMGKEWEVYDYSI